MCAEFNAEKRQAGQRTAGVIFSALVPRSGAELRESKGKYIECNFVTQVEAQMRQYNIQLQGWHAIVALGVMAAIGGVQMYSRVRPVNDGMRAAVRTELLAEYSGRGPKDLARFVAEARQGEPVEAVPATVQRDVEFTSMAARGRMGKSAVIVRAEVTVDGGAPPDGQAVRYFRVTRKFGEEGWIVIGESNAYFYFSELIPGF